MHLLTFIFKKKEACLKNLFEAPHLKSCHKFIKQQNPKFFVKLKTKFPKQAFIYFQFSATVCLLE